ncbi:hydantoinase/oxoprolinase family protein [Leucobacter sp. cx-328]|uniref:hydantoinase/oxoprolinase N-terminal domain-containing protein n=1 Tax=unclassified Leucobacter TaxID=2621730 RepID=UPI00165E3267|nr:MULTISPECIES: hydantoinase/oxoprolinase family protein [unclassified Leucobacter]MBC9943871.1 hydantoinase/oxoprolinase family protein [Leucobacter sp. cx-328]
MSYRIGIDVGGTNTDAIVLDAERRVIASVKTPTRAQSGDGVARAIDLVLEASSIPSSEVRSAMLGTTHCTNAIVERKGLGKVGVLRLGGPATSAVPPFEGWPADLQAAVEGPSFIIAGGNEFDGREISALDEAGIREAAAAMRGKVDAIAIVGVFSPVATAHEHRAAEIVAEIIDVPISKSVEIGSIGLLERENATILNAALIRTLGDMAAGFERSLAEHGIDADIYFGQNDGTLMRLAYALKYPVFTIGCGPTNSIRGAAHLSGVSDALVVDIGGTTTDIGVLVDGFPRQSAHAAEIGGIRTNFRMPDVLSVGLGGGTIVRGLGANGTGAGDPMKLGPDSVGYRIASEALVFGGSTVTATDIAVAVGRLEIADGQAPELPADVITAADQAIREVIEEAIDQIKPSAAPVPIVLVGGGAAISPTALAGVSEVIRTEHSSAANAVGAALGDVAGQAERVFSLREMTRQEAVAHVRDDAIARAVAAGADPDTVEVLSLEELPVAYMEDTVIVRARAAGRLA